MKNKYPLLKPTAKGRSYFALINTYWKGPVNTNNRAIHRLCSLMRKVGAKKVLIEEINSNDIEIADECKALNKYFKQKVTIEAYRFTFVSKNVSMKALLNLPDDNYLATATLVNLFNPKIDGWNSYLQKAIVAIPKKGKKGLLNNYIHAKNEFTCSIELEGKKLHTFKITGTYFCQQNNLTSVCAHAALCMTINNSPSITKLITTEWINETLSIDHDNKQVGSDKGLEPEDVLTVLENAGLKFIWHNFLINPQNDYAEYIYRYMEGGAPSLLIFTTKKDKPMHVVPVIGHTLNTDIWHAEAELHYRKSNSLNYRPASEWVDHFIINDDNFGMYLCLPVNSLRKKTKFLKDREFRAYTAIVVVPNEVITPAWEAERAGVSFVRLLLIALQSDNAPLDFWLKQLVDPRTPIVARTILLTKSEYKQHLEMEDDFTGTAYSKGEVKAMLDGLPKYFYLCEITLPDLYTANKSKIIDFVYTCDKPPTTSEKEMYKRWMLVRMPGACMKNIKVRKTIDLSVKSHYPLFRKEKDSSTPEW